ncbi:MAG: hypothetical protein FK733_13175 [Asgard group archaeon]|nr:hypothetical protein [Asgard group archaeon]
MHYNKEALIGYILVNSIFFVLANTFIIVGLNALIKSQSYVFVTYISIPFFLLNIGFLFLGINPIYYNKIKRFEKEKNEDELLLLSKKRGAKGLAAICSLYRIKSNKFESEFKDMISDPYRYVYADEKMLKIISQLLLLEESEDEGEEDKQILLDTLITQTVYFIESTKELGKGMISKTQLSFNDDIVICPNCRNMAKKELLEEWLERKNSCPVCRKKMKLVDFPIVDKKG